MYYYMVLYECFRCGYNTKLKGNMKHHLNRKNVCEATEDDVEIDMIKDYYGFNDEKKTAPKQHLNSTQMHLNSTQIAPKMHPNAPFCENEDAPKQHPNDTQTPEKQHPNNTQTTPKLSSRVCNYCKKVFTRKSGLTKHLNICNIKKEVEMLAIIQNEEMIKIKRESENMKKETENMKKEIEDLKKCKNGNITNNNSNNNITNHTTNNTININNYGNEDLKHLRNKDFAKLLDGIYNAVPKLIEKIHFDPKHPENQNIKYTNKRSPYLKVIKDKKWQYVNKKHELLDLIDDKCFMLKEKYYNILEKKKYNVTEAHRDKIEEFMEKYNEEDKKMMIDLIERTELMLLNKS